MRPFTTPALATVAIFFAFAASGCGARALPPAGNGAVSAHDCVTSHRTEELLCRDLELGPGRPFSAGRQRVFGENHNWHSRIGELSVLQRTVPPDR